MNNRIGGWLSLTAALAVVLVACAPAAQPAPAPAQPVGGAALQVETKPQAAPTPTTPPVAIKKGGVLQIVQNQPTPHLDPIRSLSYLTNQPVSVIYNRLVKFEQGPKGVYNVIISPDLAERWEASSDQLTWTFYLKKGVKWANVAPLNGRELTSDDVVWSLTQHMSHPEAPQKAKYAMINTIEAKDKYTIQFKLKNFHNQFLFNLGSEPSWILPKEIESQVGNYKNWLAGTGPFIMTDYNPSAMLRYKKNPDSFEVSKVYIDEIERSVIQDRATMLASFRTGKIAIVGDSSQAFTPTEFEALKKTNPDILHEVIPSQGPKFAIRFGAKPFDDVRVRKAVNHAINREAWIATYAEGKGEYDGTFPYWRFPGFGLSQDELKRYQKYDPELSKRLLAEAGLGSGFTAKVKWTQQQFLGPIDLYIKQLEAIGIKLDTQSEQLDYPGWVSQTFVGKYSQFAMWGYGVAGLYDYMYGVHHSTGQRNGPQTSYPQVDAWLDEAVRTVDINKQIELIQKVERWALTEGLHVLPTTTTTTYLVWHPWVKNYKPALSGAYENSWFAFVWLDK